MAETIKDARLIPLTARMDDRGYLVEIIRSAGDGEPHSVAHQIKQVYLVGDMTRGTIRAFHKHAELWDWFFISHGSAVGLDRKTHPCACHHRFFIQECFSKERKNDELDYGKDHHEG